MHLTLHLTGRCNLRCRYCYSAPHGGGDMSLETAKAAVALGMEVLRRERPGGSLGVIFFGGEPLLKRNLIAEVVRHCRSVEEQTGQLFHFKVTTNGLLLDEDFLTDPDTSEVFVALSHDGVRAAHDRHRVDAGGNGSFDRLEPVVELLLRHRPHAPVMMVVTPSTVRHFARGVRFLRKRGFRYLICSLDYGAEWRNGHIRELRRQYGTLATWYYRATRREEKFYFSPFEVKIGSHVRPGSCKAERCELGRRQISVAPNGRLYPCVQFVGDGSNTDYAIGHVETGIDETARERLYALNAAEKDTCSSCAIRDRCNHYCGCLNRQATGRIDHVSPTLCAHERTVMPVVDRLAERLYRRGNALFIQKHYNELFPLVSLVEDTVARRPAQATE
ncbi:MAG: radical SAM/SPASM domain-containing protein [Armatimonadetes bacterium CG_4_10_14_3_um_filter_66_18]|nr:radical SAM protein [Armatimonadota bacterium]OIP11405.1 MAG: radical SAM/SPASM domain-containing protein [Armatimonadetes bacterium CG2_30_66_41]PIU93936.1 MAG: radical SAM/SPASM domain-containing protein [Armatimonadetes bacterium CG06_land_8_20_14_3_00_66_21]PIX48424.1 MAG: radical SAM/SPASM domain-containing protein [Armatimonadetes bacterium CG_4_8_14_3_um_filter_66_20]PIY44405.1 MAG: radical SAM/SPASM domain-containing protein [Armatimonadetes bacterium CG_4_10_14_3_um_filter_66_18]PI